MAESQNSILDVKKKTIAGMFWRFAERILAQGVNVFVSIILARILMPEEYGIVAITLIIINILNVLVTSGFGTALIQKKDADDVDFSTMFYTGIVISVVLYGIVFLLAPLIANIYKVPITTMVRVITLRLPVAAINSVQQAYVSKKLMFRKFFFVTLVGTVISAFVGIGMALNGFGAWALVGQYLTNVSIDTFMLFLTIEWRPKLVFSFARMKSLLAYSWKVVATSFIGTVCNQLKGLLIGIKYMPADLSYSSQGEKVPSFLAGNVESTLDSVLFPAMALFQEDNNKMKAVVRRSMRTSAYVIMPLMIGLAAVSENLVVLLLSEEWLDSVPYMKIACLQHAFGMMGIVNLQALKAIGRSGALLKLEFIKKPFYFIILLVTMQISPLAMAVGTACYALIASVINARPNIKFLNYTLKEQIMDIGIPVLLSMLMYAVVENTRNILFFNTFIILIIQIVVGIMFYVCVSKIFHIESFDYIWNMFIEFMQGRK